MQVIWILIFAMLVGCGDDSEETVTENKPTVSTTAVPTDSKPNAVAVTATPIPTSVPTIYVPTALENKTIMTLVSYTSHKAELFESSTGHIFHKSNSSCSGNWAIPEMAFLHIAYIQGLVTTLPTAKKWAWSSSFGGSNAFDAIALVSHSDSQNNYVVGNSYGIDKGNTDGQIYCMLASSALPSYEAFSPGMKQVYDIITGP